MGRIYAFDEHYLIDAHPSVSNGWSQEADDVSTSGAGQKESHSVVADDGTLPHIIRRLHSPVRQPNTAGAKSTETGRRAKCNSFAHIWCCIDLAQTQL